MNFFLKMLWLAIISLTTATPLKAQEFPSRPLKMIVPFAPGASTDMLTRLVADRLSPRLRQPVVVENRIGAGGNIGADFVAKAAPDGYTLVMGSIGTHATNGLIYPQMPFDAEKDFAPITLVAPVTLVLVVHPSIPAKSVIELIALLNSKPEEYSYASGGVGASQHLAGELFKYVTKTKMVHIPYKGSAGALADLLSGRVPIMFADLPLVLNHINNGSLRPLAVGDSVRSQVLPTVPTMMEAGVASYQANAWYGLFAPAHTPAPVISRLQTEVAAILKAPDVQKRLIDQGATPSGITPEEFSKFQRAEIARWKVVVQSAQIKLE